MVTYERNSTLFMNRKPWGVTNVLSKQTITIWYPSPTRAIQRRSSNTAVRLVCFPVFAYLRPLLKNNDLIYTQAVGVRSPRSTKIDVRISIRFSSSLPVPSLSLNLSFFPWFLGRSAARP